METKLLPINLVARRLRVPVRWLQSEADEGRVPCLHAGRATLANPEAVEAVLLERATHGEVANAG